MFSKIVVVFLVILPFSAFSDEQEAADGQAVSGASECVRNLNDKGVRTIFDVNAALEPSNKPVDIPFQENAPREQMTLDDNPEDRVVPVGVDPYRYTVEEDLRIIRFMYKLTGQVLGVNFLKENADTKPPTKEIKRKYEVRLKDKATGELAKGLPRPLKYDSPRRAQLFFDPNDLKRLGANYLRNEGAPKEDIENPEKQVEMGIQLFAEVLKILSQGEVAIDHREDVNGVPTAFLGYSSEDDVEYKPGNQSLTGDGKVRTVLSTTAIQLIKFVLELDKEVNSLIGEGKLKGSSIKKGRSVVDVGFRYLVAFIKHESNHGGRFHLHYPVRNINNPEVSASAFTAEGFFSNFGHDFQLPDFKKGQIGNVARYAKGFEERIKLEYAIVNGLTRSEPNTLKRVEFFEKFKAAFGVNDLIGLTTVESMSKDELIKSVGQFLYGRRSILWDSFAKVYVIEEEGFGINRMVLNGYGRDLVNLSNLVQLLRSDSAVDDRDPDLDLPAWQIEQLRKIRNGSAGDTIVASLWKKLRAKFRPHFVEKGLFGLLAQGVGNDLVGYYLTWDALYSSMGFELEPPVITMLLAHSMTVLINHRLQEVVDAKERGETGPLATLADDEIEFINDWIERVFGNEYKFNKLKKAYVNVPFEQIRAKFFELRDAADPEARLIR